MDSEGVLGPAEMFDELGADYEAAFHEAPLVWEGLDALLERVRHWLTPEGVFALLTVPGDIEQRVVRFLGHPIRATSFAAEQWPEMLEEAGLEVLWSRSEPFVPTGRSSADTEQHLLLPARKA